MGARTFSEAVASAKNEWKSLTASSIFLSHCHVDKDQVHKTIVFLRSHGVRVYVDWLDSSLPKFPDSETAETIKSKIKECDKFILIATNKAIESKWCNWELGFGDAHKFIDKIGLLPLSENSGSWDGSEYLKIYPRIEESDFVSDFFKIIYPDGKELSLREWLKS